jgi:hypothetical protein
MSGGFCVPSGEIATGTAAAAYAGPCYLIGVQLISDGTNDPKVILYDDPDSANGTVLVEMSFDVSQSGKITDSFFPTKPIRCDYGIWVVPTGTGATAIVYYEERG